MKKTLFRRKTKWGLFCIWNDLESARIFFIFSSSFSFFGKELENKRKLKSPFFFSSFFFLFVSFLPFFRLFLSSFRSPFLLWRGNGSGEGVGIFPLLFLHSFLFWEKNERINWKKSKEVFPLFLLNFLSFFLLKALLIFSFFFFLGRRNWEWRG